MYRYRNCKAQIVAKVLREEKEWNCTPSPTSGASATAAIPHRCRRHPTAGPHPPLPGAHLRQSRPRSRPSSARLRSRAGRGSIAEQSEQLHCLLTEGLPRYCSAIQRSKITAAIINHFRVVEHAAAIGKAEVEARVLTAIDGLIRAGYILKPQRDDIGTVATREIRERFARIVGNKLPCPDPPWWAIWK